MAKSSPWVIKPGVVFFPHLAHGSRRSSLYSVLAFVELASKRPKSLQARSLGSGFFGALRAIIHVEGLLNEPYKVLTHKFHICTKIPCQNKIFGCSTSLIRKSFGLHACIGRQFSVRHTVNVALTSKLIVEQKRGVDVERNAL